jgi:hypothetical protein
MDQIRERLKNPVVVGVLALVIGFFIGLVIFGWGLTPVEWTDAAISDLRPDLQEEYLRMAIEGFIANPNAAVAQKRWADLGSVASEMFNKIAANPQGIPPSALSTFSAVVQSGVVAPVETQAAVTTPAPTEDGSNFLSTLLTIFLILMLVVGVALVVLWFLRNRQPEATGVRTPAQQAAEAARNAEWTDYAESEMGAPIAQFMASYKLGDDLFDDSFSIDSAAGEFLGECGVGISETIGVGDPKKVTAFEVWLFDKNDIQTVTKVLMSAHAFSDQTIRQRLAAKGEPVQCEPSGQTVLETATLRLVARVVDMNYGEGALPAESFFDNMILELAIWQK